MKKTAIAAVVMTLAFSAAIYAEGLDTLIQVGKSMADINTEMDKQTRAFNGVKSAVDSGQIKKGMPKGDIGRKYAEPVIANDDSATGREKWVYMPASSTFFKGVRIYLYFDAQALLDEIRILS